MQFGRNWVINDKVKVPHVQADHRQPFWCPSWLSFVGKKPYSNLSESLIEVISI